jgi:hypothetical protein
MMALQTSTVTDRCAENISGFQCRSIANVVIVEMSKEDVFELVLFLVEQLNQELFHPVVKLGQSPIPGVDQKILSQATDQIDSALHVAV